MSPKGYLSPLGNILTLCSAYIVHSKDKKISHSVWIAYTAIHTEARLL